MARCCPCVSSNLPSACFCKRWMSILVRMRCLTISGVQVLLRAAIGIRIRTREYAKLRLIGAWARQ